jgi:hypothetical protein
MIRHTEQEQLQRLTAKTLDQVIIAQAQEGLGCSLFEAQALTELVKEVYFPWLAQPEALQAEIIMRKLSVYTPITMHYAENCVCNQ